MGDMERVHKSVLRRVHAHGGDNNTVGQRQIFDPEGLEQQWRLVSTGEGRIDRTKIATGTDGLGDVEAFLRVDKGLFLGERRELGGGHSEDGSLERRRGDKGVGSRPREEEGRRLERSECRRWRCRQTRMRDGLVEAMRKKKRGSGGHDDRSSLVF